MIFLTNRIFASPSQLASSPRPKGGIKGAELSLYLFYNVFSVLKNLDKVLPTPEQTGGIEGKVEALQLKAAEFAEQVKQVSLSA